MKQMGLLRLCVWKADACAATAIRLPAQLEQRRTVFWGHDTLEDQWDRKRQLRAKDVISWTDPQASPEQKKEFIWAPARISAEAAFTKRHVSKLTNTTEYYSWVTKNFWPQWINFLFFPVDFREKARKNAYSHLVESQEFIRERLLRLGPDLAAAHVLCHNNCRVRFRGHKDWTELSGDGSLDIPATYVKGWHVEAIDCSSSRIVYEGLQNMRNLHHLKYLDISYCEHFDVWCLDRMSGEYADTLEYLDISGSRKLDWNGLEVLWRLRKLKTLVVRDMGHVKDLNLICLLLLDVNPKLKIVGADYLDLKLLEGTEYESLLLDDGSAPLLDAGHLEGSSTSSSHPSSSISSRLAPSPQPENRTTAAAVTN